MRGTRLSAPLAGGVAMGIVCLAAPAWAACPDDGFPDRSVCDPHAATWMPTVFGAAYFAGMDDVTTEWAGGGAELVLLTWATNSPTFGPSHGRVRMDVGLFRSLGDDDAQTLVMYRAGAAVSFERNASRRLFVPYFLADLGGIWTDALGTNAFVDGGIGIYLYYGRSIIFDVEGSWVLPLSEADALGGPQLRASLSFSLW
jgi:hypothetical protein